MDHLKNVSAIYKTSRQISGLPYLFNKQMMCRSLNSDNQPSAKNGSLHVISTVVRNFHLILKQWKCHQNSIWNLSKANENTGD